MQADVYCNKSQKKRRRGGGSDLSCAVLPTGMAHSKKKKKKEIWQKFETLFFWQSLGKSTYCLAVYFVAGEILHVQSWQPCFYVCKDGSTRHGFKTGFVGSRGEEKSRRRERERERETRKEDRQKKIHFFKVAEEEKSVRFFFSFSFICSSVVMGQKWAGNLDAAGGGRERFSLVGFSRGGGGCLSVRGRKKKKEMS